MKGLLILVCTLLILKDQKDHRGNPLLFSVLEQAQAAGQSASWPRVLAWGDWRSIHRRQERGRRVPMATMSL